MSKFISSLPSNIDVFGRPKKRSNLEMFLQECKDDRTYYRVRLLNFIGPQRKHGGPIGRYVHTVWTTDPETGKKSLNKVVCPSKTPWIETEGPKQSACKICNCSGHYYTIYNESGKTDKEALSKASKFRASPEIIVPVYVINDPNYEKNNGKMKVIVIDADSHEILKAAMQKQEAAHIPIFNGGEGADCLIHFSKSAVRRNPKTGAEFTRWGIDKVKFSTTLKEIPAINDTTLDAFKYDETYMVKSSDDEINDFYDAHCVISNDDIPEDDEIPVYRPSASIAPKAVVPTNSAATEKNLDNDEVDELLDKPSQLSTEDPLAADPDEEGLNESSSNSTDVDLTDDAFLKELGL